MGHTINVDRAYGRLQRQLDRTLAGAPDSPNLRKILAILFSPDDAELAAQIPVRPTTVEELAEKLQLPQDELDGRIDEMAERGLVVDLEHRGRRYVTLAPVAIGFFEFTFMRTRDELPMAELARLFEQYMHQDGFVQSAWHDGTAVGRSLVHEESLPQQDHTEILDWERASHLIQSATSIGVSTCACRHKALHLGTVCDRPLDCCFSLNWAADVVIRRGRGREVTTGEAMRILEECKEAGLAQTGDNVQRKVFFICNCCGCCCELVRAARTCGAGGAIATSNWIMQVDASRCTGCGRCVEACPFDAIGLIDREDEQRPKKLAEVDAESCLGCGVCPAACTSSAISMQPRGRRVFTPETLFDRVALMAIERGKLAETIFEQPDQVGHRAIARLVQLLERTSALKAAMAIKPLRSVFLRKIVAEAKRRTGEVSEIFE